MTREEQRILIATQVEEFLADGGRIQYCKQGETTLPVKLSNPKYVLEAIIDLDTDL